MRLMVFSFLFVICLIDIEAQQSKAHTKNTIYIFDKFRNKTFSAFNLRQTVANI